MIVMSVLKICQFFNAGIFNTDEYDVKSATCPSMIIYLTIKNKDRAIKLQAREREQTINKKEELPTLFSSALWRKQAGRICDGTNR